MFEEHRACEPVLVVGGTDHNEPLTLIIDGLRQIRWGAAKEPAEARKLKLPHAVTRRLTWGDTAMLVMPDARHAVSLNNAAEAIREAERACYDGMTGRQSEQQ